MYNGCMEVLGAWLAISVAPTAGLVAYGLKNREQVYCLVFAYIWFIATTIAAVTVLSS